MSAAKPSIIERLQAGVPVKIDRWPGNDGEDVRHLTGEASATMREAATIIADLLEALKHARNQIQHPDQMIDEAIAKATA